MVLAALLVLVQLPRRSGGVGTAGAIGAGGAGGVGGVAAIRSRSIWYVTRSTPPQRI
jgi:hypothetical protein